MKFLILALASLFISSAHASFFSDVCSSASGKVRLEKGQMGHSVTFRYYDDGIKEKEVYMGDLKVEMSPANVLKEERIHKCGYASYKKTYTMEVVIGPSEEAPTALDFMGVKEVKADVICEFHVNNRAPCPENQ